MNYKLFRDALGKNCSRCKQYKVFEDYSMHTASADCKQSQCKQCFAERARLFRKGSPCIRCGSPKEHGVPQGAKLCVECAKVCSTCGANPRDKHRTRCKVCIATADKIRAQLPERQYRQRITRIVGKYKVDREEAERLEATKTCEVCAKTFTRPGDRHVDHCHTTGKVRGVLCFNCNGALGHVNDSVRILGGLVLYLHKSRSPAP